ncbi:CDGSH iron-sulfur domain-containing protein [Pseudomonas sp. SP16.1]|uniref:CDGSH iron-sulfur domain-containing protein n=1 Tax=Pseudomonas sp. SP16.1 TaxID=3458854 RepID=UPI004046622C
MVDDPLPILPEARLVKPGETHRLCRCGRSSTLPDCNRACADALRLTPVREQRLLLCRCGRSADLPYCDGRHSPPAPGLRDKWRRFRSGD